MAHPRVNITIEIQSTNTRMDMADDTIVSVMDEPGRRFMEEELRPFLRARFGDLLDSVNVTAKHSLVGVSEQAA